MSLNFSDLRNEVVKEKQCSCIISSEQTKMSFVSPLLTYLGFNIHNRHEVECDFSCGIVSSVNESIDFAIHVDKKEYILVDVKSFNTHISDSDILKLSQYFNVSKVKYGVITNGVIYQFYTDFIEENKMDATPFFIFDITNYSSKDIEVLDMFKRCVLPNDDIALLSSDNGCIEHKVTECIKKHILGVSDELFNFIKTQIGSSDLTKDVLKECLDRMIRPISFRLRVPELSLDLPVTQGIFETGKSGRFTLDSVERCKPVSCKLLGVYDRCSSSVVTCKSFADITCYLIDYEFNNGVTEDDLVEYCNRVVSNPVISTNPNDFRVAGYYKGFYYEKNSSVEDTVKRAYTLCTDLGINMENFELILCNKNQYKNWKYSGISYNVLIRDVCGL